jgi:hypothetical protein
MAGPNLSGIVCRTAGTAPGYTSEAHGARYTMRPSRPQKLYGPGEPIGAFEEQAIFALEE